MKRVLVLGVCALFIACGGSTERGIASVPSVDKNANGLAYKGSDTAFSSGAHAASSAAPVPVEAVPAAEGTAVAPAAEVTTAASDQTPKQAPAKTPAAAAAKPAQNDNGADVKKGEALISKSDCLACHKVQDKLLGPSYKEVAAKYPNNPANVAKLVDKIKKGGSGVWGPIPMSPHPALSDDDAKAMVQYILSIK